MFKIVYFDRSDVGQRYLHFYSKDFKNYDDAFNRALEMRFVVDVIMVVEFKQPLIYEIKSFL